MEREDDNGRRGVVCPSQHCADSSTPTSYRDVGICSASLARPSLRMGIWVPALYLSSAISQESYFNRHPQMLLVSLSCLWVAWGCLWDPACELWSVILLLNKKYFNNSRDYLGVRHKMDGMGGVTAPLSVSYDSQDRDSLIFWNWAPTNNAVRPFFFFFFFFFFFLLLLRHANKNHRWNQDLWRWLHLRSSILRRQEEAHISFQFYEYEGRTTKPLRCIFLLLDSIQPNEHVWWSSSTRTPPARRRQRDFRRPLSKSSSVHIEYQDCSNSS